MKKFLGIALLLIALFFTPSCTKKPFACFQTDISEDSIHVNQLVLFYSACSNNTGEFFWEFYRNGDSVYFSRNVEKVFYDTGYVEVFLMVGNGRKSSTMTKNIHINP